MANNKTNEYLEEKQEISLNNKNNGLLQEFPADGQLAIKFMLSGELNSEFIFTMFCNSMNKKIKNKDDC